MTAGTRPSATIRDDVDVEAFSGVKHEFVGGQIIALSGGTPDHAGIAAGVKVVLDAEDKHPVDEPRRHRRGHGPDAVFHDPLA